MPLSRITIDSQSVTVAAAGTAIAPARQLSENTHTLIAYNADAGEVWFNWTGGAGGALTKSESVIVPAGGSVTLAPGPRTERSGGSDLESGLSVDASNNGAVLYLTFLSGPTV